jgi:hypothetical protein
MMSSSTTVQQGGFLTTGPQVTLKQPSVLHICQPAGGLSPHPEHTKTHTKFKIRYEKSRHKIKAQVRNEVNTLHTNNSQAVNQTHHNKQ